MEKIMLPLLLLIVALQALGFGYFAENLMIVLSILYIFYSLGR